MRGINIGNYFIFTEQKQNIYTNLSKNINENDGKAILEMNKKNLIYFRSNFNFGFAKHIKYSQ